MAAYQQENGLANVSQMYDENERLLQNVLEVMVTELLFLIMICIDWPRSLSKYFEGFPN